MIARFMRFLDIERQLFTAFSCVTHFGRSRKQYIRRGIERCFAAVLDHADDETNADDLHGDITRQTEQAAGERDEQERTTWNTGSTCGTRGSQEDKQDRRREVHGDAFRIAV